MFEKKHKKSHGKPKETLSQKSSVTLPQFKERIQKLGYGITSFSRFSGIARTTIDGWKPCEEDKKKGIVHKVPLYAIRLVEALEKQNELERREKERRFQMEKLYEINTKYFKEFQTI